MIETTSKLDGVGGDSKFFSSSPRDRQFAGTDGIALLGCLALPDRNREYFPVARSTNM